VSEAEAQQQRQRQQVARHTAARRHVDASPLAATTVISSSRSTAECGALATCATPGLERSAASVSRTRSFGAH
jgi:hypothetical protein